MHNPADASSVWRSVSFSFPISDLRFKLTLQPSFYNPRRTLVSIKIFVFMQVNKWPRPRRPASAWSSANSRVPAVALPHHGYRVRTLEHLRGPKSTAPPSRRRRPNKTAPTPPTRDGPTPPVRIPHTARSSLAQARPEYAHDGPTPLLR